MLQYTAKLDSAVNSSVGIRLNNLSLGNLNNLTLEDNAYLALRKRSNYAVSPVTMPTENIISRAGKTVGALLDKAVLVSLQVTVRMLKGSSLPRGNLINAQRKFLQGQC